MKNFIIFLSNFSISYILTLFSIIPFTSIIPDKPNERSAHKYIKPRGGGLFIFIPSVISYCVFGQYQILLLVPLSIVSFWDDIKKIKVSIRLFTQILTVICLLYWSPYIIFQKDINNFSIITFLFGLAILIGTSIINFSNFMDGSDGLLSGCILLILLFSDPLTDINIWPICGAIFGFILLNWYPSKIFLGDIGSNFLGGFIILILLNTHSYTDILKIILLTTPLFADSSFCIIRRLINHQNIFSSHSLHLYQRLIKAGWNHSRVCLTYCFFTFLIGISLYVGGLKLQIITSFLSLFIGFWLDKTVAKPFN